MRSLALIRFRDKVRRWLLIAFVAISGAALLLSLVLPGSPVLSSLLGIAAAATILGCSAFCLSKMVESEDMGIGWLALDYVAKLVGIGVVVLIAKNVSIFDQTIVGGIAIAAVIVTMAVQLLAVQQKQRDESV